jgi:hypothetical protein
MVWRDDKTSGFALGRMKIVASANAVKGLRISPMRHLYALRAAAAVSGLAAILVWGAAAPAQAAPSEPRRVHVEGQLLPVEKSSGTYRISGGLVGTYKLRSEWVLGSWTYWTTEIREIKGTESINACVDQNQNQNCDAGEPAGEVRLVFNRVASFDTSTGRLIESRSTHQVISSGSFGSGGLTTRSLPVGGTDEIVSTYAGDLQVTDGQVGSRRAD